VPVNPVAAIPRADAANEAESHLLARVADRDHAAFDELYNRMSGRILGLITRVLIDPWQSEEVAQEVFLEIWQHAARFDPSKGSATGWMFRLAHSRAIDRVRAAEASVSRDWRLGIRDWHEPQDGVEEIVERRLDGRVIDRALAHLPAAQRQAIALTHLQGYSHTAAASLLEVPLGTVKTRVRDGLARLRRQLQAA
jgi:RNA polymerase sigma-70 factor (ECF subfamily)